MTPETTQALNIAICAARKGGEVARGRLGSPGYLKWTGRRRVVTEASLEVQDAIVLAIRSELPAAVVLEKEGPDDAVVPVDASELWLVDPASGALNFAHGIPHFALSVALRRHGRIWVGVVYDPIRDELFEATAESSAMLNGRRITVRQILEGSEAWESAVVGTDWPREGERRRQARLTLGLMSDQVQSCDLMGSPALGFCYLAAGRLHGYWHLDLNIWEVAATSLIVERAGGIFTDAEGLTWLHSDGGYIASNDVIHGSLLNCIRSVR